ncbi:hypothetical protein Q0Q10_22860, partial [Escherichia coli OX21:H7]
LGLIITFYQVDRLTVFEITVLLIRTIFYMVLWLIFATPFRPKKALNKADKRHIASEPHDS